LADDNASGVATLLEALRAILRDPVFAQGHAPNTLEFHFYAAEEVGLQGSLQIFDSYSRQGREVKAMLNQDMTGYTGHVGINKPECIGVLTDNVDLGLTEFVRMIIATVSDPILIISIGLH
jgi:leucyl aminopeptidase